MAVREVRTPAPIAKAVTRDGIDLQLHDTLDALESEWLRFEADAHCTVFQTFAWLSAWQRHVGDRLGTWPAVVLGRGVAGSLLFIMPLAITRSGVVRRLTWLGSDLCDYNAPLMSGSFFDHPGCARFAELWDEISSMLAAQPAFRFDRIELVKMPELIGSRRNPFLDLPVRDHPSGSYVATLGRDWQSFYAERRSAATRKRERRQLRQLGEHGEVRFGHAADPHAVEATLATLFLQKAGSLERMGVENFLKRQGYTDFFREIATPRGAGQFVHVGRLDIGETTVAASYGLKFRGRFYLVMSSYQDGEIARFGPGRAHLNELIRYAIEHGYETFDFTVGDEPYKQDWADTEVRLFDHLSARTAIGVPSTAGKLGARWAKRLVKRTPVLWRTYTRARAFGGRLRHGRRDGAAARSDDA